MNKQSSMNASIFITGGAGFLGGWLAARAGGCMETYATYHHKAMPPFAGVASLPLDIRDLKAVQTTLARIRPTAVIHAAANARPDTCEAHPQEAWDVNVAATQYLAQAAQTIGARFIFISTDLVFDGRRGGYAESDTPAPLSIYGQTKLDAEKIIQTHCDNYVITRVALCYGPGINHYRCSTELMVDALRKGTPLPLFVDEYRTPSEITSLAEALLRLALQEKVVGLYHLGGPERISRYELGMNVAKIFGLDTTAIQPVTLCGRTDLSYRPLDCSLDCRKIFQETGIQLRAIEPGLQEMKRHLITS